VHTPILVVGELNVDLIMADLTGFPVLGQEIVARDSNVVLGSSSAICAAGMARLGVPVDFVGKVGADDYGRFLIKQLRLLGVSTVQVICDPGVRTGVTVCLSYPHDRAMVTYLGAIGCLQLKDIDVTLLRRYSHLHIGSYFLQKQLQPALPDLFAEAHRQGLTISLDPGCDPSENWATDDLINLLEQVDLFLPNETEACAIAQEMDIEKAVARLADMARLVVVKTGASGATTLLNREIVYSPSFPVVVIDTTGAGDSFDAGFIYAHIVQGLAIREALRFANACGALSTTAVGGTAAQPTLKQVIDFLEAETRRLTFTPIPCWLQK
jgi:sugar/nucleoside kinase (ribokinase family)